jgi:hypothetical protein
MTDRAVVATDLSWVPDSCTLPTPDQPLRVAELQQLLADDALDLSFIAPDHLRLALAAEPGVAARVAELAAREAHCCGFFTFSLTITAGALTLDVTVPQTHTDVLRALAS